MFSVAPTASGRWGDDFYSMSSDSRWHISSTQPADQACILSDKSAIWYPVVGEWCSLSVQMKAFHIHLLISPFFLPSSVHRLKHCVQALEEQANGDPQLLSCRFSLPLFLLFLSFLRSPSHWEQEMSSEEKSSTMSQKISSPSHSNSSSSSKHDSRQVSVHLLHLLHFATFLEKSYKSCHWGVTL